MKNSTTSLVLIFLLVASFLTFAATIPAYGEGEESNQQTLASTLDSWTWIMVIFIIAVLAGALLLFIIAFLQSTEEERTEKKSKEPCEARARLARAMNRNLSLRAYPCKKQL